MRTGMKMNPTTMKNLNIVLCLIDHPKCAGTTCAVNIYLIGFVKQKKVLLLPHLIGAINPSLKSKFYGFKQIERKIDTGNCSF